MHYLSADSQNKLNSAVKEFAANYATDVSPDLLEEMIQLRHLHRLKFGDACLSPLDLLNMSGINESLPKSLHQIEHLLTGPYLAPDPIWRRAPVQLPPLHPPLGGPALSFL